MKAWMVALSAAALALAVGTLLLTTPAVQVSADAAFTSASLEGQLLPPSQSSSAYQLGSWCYIDCGDDGTTDHSVYLQFYTWSTCACTCSDLCGGTCFSQTAVCGTE